MQVHTQFSFNNANEYKTFCEHMAKLPISGIDKSDAKQTSADVSERPHTSKASLEAREIPGKKSVSGATPAKAEVAEKPAKKPETKAKGADIPPDGERLDNEPTYENMKKAVLAVSQKYGSKKPAFAILKAYGIEKITPDIEEEHFAPIIKDCQASLDAADAASDEE